MAESVFYPSSTVEVARTNAARCAWAARTWQAIIDRAEPWLQFSDDELWGMMFGPTIKRAWMVWSDGHCPGCRAPVTMYNWQVDALVHPWKVRCPHCSEFYPKNDFKAFYDSGLDERGIFCAGLADRSLLYNVEHPDANDPLHVFGVDDGEGYAERGHRWWFIGAYLIRGHWKQLVLGGIVNLSVAYLATGDQVYAHKAGVLLDRVADLYPTFDFGEQGILYEVKADCGYVSTWHDACEETRELALAYDRVVDTLQDDAAVVSFLSAKAGRYGLDNPKATWVDIQRNIEDRILRDALRDHRKIRSNYPREEMTRLTIEAILGWEGNRHRVYQLLDALIAEAVAVDGVTGEKGLTAYGTIGPRGVAETLGMFARADPNILRDVLQRHPRLYQLYRFHIDTWCMDAYYPTVGDCGGYARPDKQYVGATFSDDPGIEPSMYTFFWDLYQLTGDAALVQVLYRANGDSVAGLPYDLFADDPVSFQEGVCDIIAQVGTHIDVGSLNKQEWRLAILRSPSSALWLHYDAGGRHSHRDSMNLGLFGKGLDLMPDFGYPPVQYGGWHSVRANWYKMSAAHNTVVVDGQDHQIAEAKTALWVDADGFRAIRVSGAGLIGGRQYERTAALVDISDADSYVVDVFRVVGGKEHSKFFHSHFGTIAVKGLDLEPAEAYGRETQMRNFRGDPDPRPGWRVNWQIDDRYGLLPPGSDVHLAYTDLTTGAGAFVAEGWVSLGDKWSVEEAWVPRLMVCRRSRDAPLASTFVAVVEPYEGTSKISGIRRLPLETAEGELCSDANVAIEIQLVDGRRDLFVAVDVENLLHLNHASAEGRVLVHGEWDLCLDGELHWIRRNADGSLDRVWPGS